MSETSQQEYVCAVCGMTFYLQQKGVKLFLCGDDQICRPPDKRYKDPECKIYYFCSDECAEDLKDKISTCRPVSGWKRLMGRIGSIGTEKGIAGSRVHDLYKKK